MTERERATYQSPPPDAGGHVGTTTRPEQLQQAPEEGPSPPLDRDATRTRGRGSCVAIAVAVLILAVAFVLTVARWA